MNQSNNPNSNQFFPYEANRQQAYQPYPPMTQQPQFSTQPTPYPTMPSGSMIPGTAGGVSGAKPQVPGMLPAEESYIENILRLNKGKLATVHMTFENAKDGTKVFTGIIQAAGRDHLILSDPQSERRYLLPLVYLDYITFDEPIEYEYPFPMGLASYPPR